MEEWFRVSVSVRVRARAREYSSSFLSFFFFCLILALNKPIIFVTDGVPYGSSVGQSMAGHLPGRGFESLPESLSLSFPLFIFSLFLSFSLTLT